MITLMKMPIRHGSAPLRVARGHFATNHSHINYYVDITYQKTRLSEAKDSARQLVANFVNDTPVDTILCLDGTGVVGTCLAQELTKSGFRTINAHETIYILEPEYNANSQIIFRDNTQGMIRGKHVLVLMASVTTGYTAKRALEAITYYGGTVAGVAAIYSAVDQVEGYPVRAVYTIQDLPGYASYDYRECPTARPGRKSTPWSTASAIRSCKVKSQGPARSAGPQRVKKAPKIACHSEAVLRLVWESPG